jgi:hypothetical protein
MERVLKLMDGKGVGLIGGGCFVITLAIIGVPLSPIELSRIRICRSYLRATYWAFDTQNIQYIIYSFLVSTYGSHRHIVARNGVVYS